MREVGKKSNAEKNDLASLFVQERLIEMPMLRSVFNDFIKLLQKSLSGYTAASFQVSMDTILALHASDYIPSIKQNDVICIEYKFEGFADGNFLVVITKNLIYQFIETVLGGGNNNQLRIDDRQFTVIEKNIIGEVAQIILYAFNDVFKNIGNENEISLADIYYTKGIYGTILDKSLIMTRLNVSFGNDDNNMLDIAMPYDALLPMKSKLMKGFVSKKALENNYWYQYLSDALLQMDVNMTVEVDCTDSKITDIERMRVGDTLVTYRNATDSLDLKVNGTKFSKCKIGKINNKIAIEITS